jgi:hypothetical protein
MTRKDYILIAEVIRASKLSWAGNNNYLVDDISRALADTLEQDNPRFNRARFLTACGVK